MTVYDYLKIHKRHFVIYSALFYVLVFICSWCCFYLFFLHVDKQIRYGQDAIYWEADHDAELVEDFVSYGATHITDWKDWTEAGVSPKKLHYIRRLTTTLSLILCGILLVLFIWPPSFLNIMPFNQAHSKLINLPEYREIYRVASTQFMTVGLATPEIYVIGDLSINIFTTGLSPRWTRLIVTRGALKYLSKSELEAAFAQITAQVVRQDVRILFLLACGIWVAGMVLFLLWAGYSDRSSHQSFLIAWILLFIFGVYKLLLPLISRAVSRTCILRSDDLAVLICRNPKALASALNKMVKNAYVCFLKNHPHLFTASVANPNKKPDEWPIDLLGICDTHPSLFIRLKNLQDMDRGA